MGAKFHFLLASTVFISAFILGAWFFLKDILTHGGSSSASLFDERPSILESLMDAPTFELHPEDFKDVESVSRQNAKAKKNQAFVNRHEYSTCSHFSCFDIYKCKTHGLVQKKIAVHIPKPKVFTVKGNSEEFRPWTEEFVEILEAVEASPYYTQDPEEACISIPAVDLLNINSGEDENALTAAALNATDSWGTSGANNLLFVMLPGTEKDGYAPRFSAGKAMIAGAGLSASTFREGFDISIPTYSPQLQGKRPWIPGLNPNELRRWKISLVQTNLKKETRAALAANPQNSLESFVKCENGRKKKLKGNKKCHRSGDGTPHEYPDILSKSTFCLVLRGIRLTQTLIMDAMHQGCIPVIAVDSLVLPFSEVLDWDRFSVRIYEHELHKVWETVSRMSARRIRDMRKQLDFVYERHFRTLANITRTTLDILNDRVIGHRAKTYSDWNLRSEESARVFGGAAGLANPLANIPINAAAVEGDQGFTAVILTYDRMDSLFAVMRKISDTPSLAKILVIWNNQNVEPPPTKSKVWPKISKPFEVVRTTRNALSNRFYPYEQIKTECFLSLDDDIGMLTPDELEFGYRTWREFPDRIVGFPSRTHVWNGTRWRYESEWTSEISMVLTGAAFLHKYWSYLYTASPNPESSAVKAWVDDHMNCEDIAMNFLVANVTGKSPVKVAPRKKFRCATPACINSGSISGIQDHMIERSDCVNLFAEKYGWMPLKTVEFRADPVLYREKLPAKLKRFPDIGSL